MRIVLFLVLLCFAAMAADDAPLREAPKVLVPEECGIGRALPDVKLNSLDGEPTSLSKLITRKALVLAIWTPPCPISKKYAPRIVELARAYGTKDVVSALLNRSADSAAESTASFE